MFRNIFSPSTTDSESSGRLFGDFLLASDRVDHLHSLLCALPRQRAIVLLYV